MDHDFRTMLQRITVALDERLDSEQIASMIVDETADGLEPPASMRPPTRVQPNLPREVEDRFFSPRREARLFVGTEIEYSSYSPQKFWTELDAICANSAPSRPCFFVFPYATPDCDRLDEPAWFRVPAWEIRITQTDKGPRLTTIRWTAKKKQKLEQLIQDAISACLQNPLPLVPPRRLHPRTPNRAPDGSWPSTWDPVAARRAILRAQTHMDFGECYLLNYSVRVRDHLHPDDFRASQLVRQWVHSPARFAWFASAAGHSIMSLSPERFVARTAQWLLTEPIKGTTAAPPGIESGELEARMLWASEKEINEQTLVVDLLRHDFNSVCTHGTVNVVKPFFVRLTPQLAQMQSFVVGECPPHIPPGALLQQLLPAGSITGTPKIKVCKIIEELEQEPRGYYTGIAGVIDPNGDLDSTLLIRSHFCGDLGIYAGTGCGITTLSNPTAEAIELRAKLRSFWFEV